MVLKKKLLRALTAAVRKYIAGACAYKYACICMCIYIHINIHTRTHVCVLDTYMGTYKCAHILEMYVGDMYTYT